MRLRIALAGDLKGFAERKEKQAARGVSIAARQIGTRAKLAFREDVRAGGLGDRLANTWQDKVYPQNKESMRAAAFVFSKAPELIRSHTDGAIIRGRDAVYLAIPTEHTPRKGRRLATPVEVEAMFNQDLILFPGRGQQVLVFVDAIRAKSGRGFRRATKRRTKDGRSNELVLMFVLVKQVRMRVRLRWPKLAADLGVAWRDLIGASVAREMASA